MALILSTPQAQQTQSFFLVVRDLYDAREKPSKAYSWKAMLTSFVLLEMAYNIITATIFWVPWYYMVQFGSASVRAAYSWVSFPISIRALPLSLTHGVRQFQGVIVLFSVYWATFALAIASMAATAATGPYDTLQRLRPKR
jgi:ABC-type multidrug transport system permease subunit